MKKSKLQLPVSDKPIREQICDYFIELIESGQLTAGSVLPPTRELALQLSVSRDTVVRAYYELERLSCIRSSSTRGYFVAKNALKNLVERVPLHLRKEAPDASEEMSILHRLSVYGQDVARFVPDFPVSSDFALINFGGPDPDLLPVRRWKENVRYYADRVNELNRHPEIMGQKELREAIAGYLGRTKQIQCRPESVAVFSNTHSATMLLCRLLLNTGDTIAVEEPGFGGIRNVARTLHMELLPVPTDKEGMMVETLFRTQKRVKLVYLTPCHNEPTGATLSHQRRLKLLEWAKANDVWIIEDDFDGFFYYGESPPPALRAIDDGGSVIYLVTFWRLLYPLTSIGFCLLPRQLTTLIERTKLEVEGVSESLAQLTVARMMEDGYLERYMRKLRNTYAMRRSVLIESLHKGFGKSIEMIGPGSGTQLWCRLANFSDEAVINAAAQVRLPVISASAYYLVKPALSTHLFDFSCLPEQALSERSAHFARILQGGKTRK
jgi:GntR family transcriptional regulator/MocR family aminotransferase